MIYYIGDLHFGHRNCLNFDRRPFKDLDEMHTALIRNWNSTVSKDDTVYIVGDFSFRSSIDPVEYLTQLNGHKFLARGNHDDKLIKSLSDHSTEAHVEDIRDIYKVTDGVNRVIVCHFPLADWEGKRHGNYHVYAHVHANLADNALRYMLQEEKALNAGVMINNYTPATLGNLVLSNNKFKQSIGL